MKYILHIFSLSFLAIFTSCSNNDEPEHRVFMQPASITSTDANGWNQSFDYDEYGRIVSWTETSNSENETTCSALFDYSDENTINVTSVDDFLNGEKRYYQETIKLINGRASESEGTFISEVNGNSQLRKTYRLAFEYDNSNHLAVVKHSEVVGIGTDIKEGAWDKAWSWENYLIWEDGNLKEFEDYQGHATVYRTTKYEYYVYATEYPLITPIIINNNHHTPLVMQGIFGSNPINLIKASTIFDDGGNLDLSRQYAYEFEDARIIGYTETNTYNTAFSKSISYSVNWTENFKPAP